MGGALRHAGGTVGFDAKGHKKQAVLSLSTDVGLSKMR